MMLNRFLTAARCALCALLAAAAVCCLASMNARAEAGGMQIAADRWERELYRDDTAITLSVSVPADCVGLTVSQLGGSGEIYADWLARGRETVYANLALDPLYYTEAYRALSFTPENAAVSETEAGKTWTVTVDFGLDGVYGLLVTAQRASGAVIEQKAPVYVRYPSVNTVNEGVCAAWEAYILRDSDAPFCFVLDLSQTALDYKSVPEITLWGRYAEYTGGEAVYCSRAMLMPGQRRELFGEEDIDPWQVKFASDSPVYGEMVLWDAIPFDLRLVSRSFAGEKTWVNPIDDLCFPTGDVVLCRIAETENERIACSARAAVCALRGGTVNASLFP